MPERQPGAKIRRAEAGEIVKIGRTAQMAGKEGKERDQVAPVGGLSVGRGAPFVPEPVGPGFDRPDHRRGGRNVLYWFVGHHSARHFSTTRARNCSRSLL